MIELNKTSVKPTTNIHVSAGSLRKDTNIKLTVNRADSKRNIQDYGEINYSTNDDLFNETMANQEFNDQANKTTNSTAAVQEEGVFKKGLNFLIGKENADKTVAAVNSAIEAGKEYADNYQNYLKANAPTRVTNLMNTEKAELLYFYTNISALDGFDIDESTRANILDFLKNSNLVLETGRYDEIEKYLKSLILAKNQYEIERIFTDNKTHEYMKYMSNALNEYSELDVGVAIKIKTFEGLYNYAIEHGNVEDAKRLTGEIKNFYNKTAYEAINRAMEKEPQGKLAIAALRQNLGLDDSNSSSSTSSSVKVTEKYDAFSNITIQTRVTNLMNNRKTELLNFYSTLEGMDETSRVYIINLLNNSDAVLATGKYDEIESYLEALILAMNQYKTEAAFKEYETDAYINYIKRSIQNYGQYFDQESLSIREKMMDELNRYYLAIELGRVDKAQELSNEIREFYSKVAKPAVEAAIDKEYDWETPKASFLDEVIDASTNFLPSLGNIALSIPKGVMKFGEALGDTGIILGSGILTLGSTGKDLLDGILYDDWEFNTTKELWNDTTSLVARNITSELDEVWLGETKAKLDETAYVKSNSEICKAGEGAGYIAGVLLLNLVLPGSSLATQAAGNGALATSYSGAVAGGIIAGTAGFGKNAEVAYQNGANAIEGIAYGGVQGLFEGAEMFIGYEINGLKLFDGAGLLPQIGNSLIHVALDSADGAAGALADPLFSMIYDPSEQTRETILHKLNYDENGEKIHDYKWNDLTFEQKYKGWFEYNGGWDTVATQAASAAIMSTITELPEIARSSVANDLVNTITKDGFTKGTIESIQNLKGDTLKRFVDRSRELGVYTDASKYFTGDQFLDLSRQFAKDTLNEVLNESDYDNYNRVMRELAEKNATVNSRRTVKEVLKDFINDDNGFFGFDFKKKTNLLAQSEQIANENSELRKQIMQITDSNPWLKTVLENESNIKQLNLSHEQLLIYNEYKNLSIKNSKQIESVLKILERAPDANQILKQLDVEGLELEFVNYYIDNIEKYAGKGISIQKFLSDHGISTYKIDTKLDAALALGDSKLYVLSSLEEKAKDFAKYSNYEIDEINNVLRKYRSKACGDIDMFELFNDSQKFLDSSEAQIVLELANNGVVDNYAKSLTYAEKAAIFNYTACGGFEINGYLGDYGGMRSYFNSVAEIQDLVSGKVLSPNRTNRVFTSSDGDIVEALDSVIANSKYEGALVTYRGLQDFYDGNNKLNISDLEVGQKIKSAGNYQSSSAVFDNNFGANNSSHNIILEIVIPPKSGVGAYIENFTGVTNYNQMEVLLKRDAELVVCGDPYKIVYNGVEKTIIPVIAR